MLGARLLGWLTGFFLIATLLAQNAHSSVERYLGFVSISADRAVYVDYRRPAPGKPLVVLLNGLTYQVSSWDTFVNNLYSIDPGVGILRYDMMGQGKTLLKYAPITEPVPLADQVRDLGLLLDALQIYHPVHLVSLSYGGAVAIPFATQQPERVASVILMAPFVAPLTFLDSWIRLQIHNTRLMFPTNPATDDELYDYFLRLIVFSTYPAYEPVVVENPYKLEATYRLVQGSRKFLAKDYAHALPAGRVHLMVALQDQYIERPVHDRFWEHVPQHARASRLYIDGSEHKIPEAIPSFSAKWVHRIINGDPQLSSGRSFYGRVLDEKIVPL